MNKNEGQRSLLWDVYGVRAVRLFLGAVFLIACMDKILHPEAFAGVVANYQILPRTMVNMVALVLPWVELLAAVCLLGSVWMPAASVTVTVLLMVFTGTLVFNMVRGLDVQCGCFSSSGGGAEAAPMWWYLIRDGGLLLVSVFLTHRSAVPVLRGSSGAGPAGYPYRRPKT